MKTILLKITLILVTLGVSVGGTIYIVPKGILKSEFSKRVVRRKESELIGEALNNLVEVACKEGKNKKQYCGRVRFTINYVNPHPETLYANGSVKTRDNKEFYWAAVKTKGSWSELYIEDPDKSIPDCLEVDNFPSEIFNQKFRFCMDDKGQKIDRLLSK